MPRQLDLKQLEDWAPVFFPKDFVRTNFGLTLENFELDVERLMLEGSRVTAIRRSFREKAERIAEETGQ